MKLEFFSTDFLFENTQIQTSMKIREVGAEIFQGDGGTDGEKEGQTDMTKLIAAFRNFAKKHLKLQTYKRQLNIKIYLFTN